jgi:hypothetical protein
MDRIGKTIILIAFLIPLLGIFISAKFVVISLTVAVLVLYAFVIYQIWKK